MVGSGIFVLPAQVAQLLGTASLSAYLAAGIAAGLIVLCFAEVGALFERSGGPYLYARAAFGDFAGFEIGWMLLTARITSIAAISNAFASYLGFFWPWTTAGAGRVIVIIGAIATLTVINYRGVHYGARTVNLFTVAKLAPLFIFVVAGIFLLVPHHALAWHTPSAAALPQASLLLIFAFGGFEFAVVVGEEVIHPKRTIPIALLAAISLVAVLYIAIQYVAQGTLPELATSTTPLASSAQRFLGPIGGVLLAIGAVFSTTGTNSALMLITPRILFAMAEGQQLPQSLSRVHPRFHTPYIAIIVSAVLGCAAAMYSGFATLAAISAIARLLTYIATCVALPIFRRSMPSAQRWFAVPGGVIIPIAAVALSIWLLMGSSKKQVLISAANLAAGAAIYSCYRLFRKSQNGSKLALGRARGRPDHHAL